MKRFLIVMLILTSFPINTSSVPTNSQHQVTDAYSHEFTISPSLFESKSPGDESSDNSQLQQETKGDTSIEAAEINEEASHVVPEPEINNIVLSFAGDCTLGDDESYSWSNFKEVYNSVDNPSYFLDGVKSVFMNDDFTFVNLEGVLTNATKKVQKKFRHRGDPAYCEILTAGSVEGVTLANNHTLDYFEKGFEDTVKTLNNAGIDYTYLEKSLIKEIKGMKIGFLGYKAWSYERKSEDLLMSQVKDMREQGVDFIVANFHWGDQKVYTPNSTQKRMGHFAIDNGVDLVIGHHPHVLQGMEIYKGKNIVYSLGNFCYGGSPNPRDKDTIIYQQIITFDCSQKKIIGSEYKIIPASISSLTDKNNYQPVIVSGEEEKRIREKYEKISEGL